jgi:hypothetical protein
MARAIKPTFKQWIPGAGRTVGGVPVQGKTRTVGRISVTSYNQGGEALSPADLGLSAIDALTLKVREQSMGASDTREVAYSPSAQLFYLFTLTGAGVTAEYAAAATEEVEFVAEGDSALDVELL